METRVYGPLGHDEVLMMMFLCFPVTHYS